MVSCAESSAGWPPTRRFLRISPMFTACSTGRYVATRHGMRAMTRRFVAVGVVAFTLLAPTAAAAVTVDQLVTPSLQRAVVRCAPLRRDATTRLVLRAGPHGRFGLPAVVCYRVSGDDAASAASLNCGLRIADCGIQIRN